MGLLLSRKLATDSRVFALGRNSFEDAGRGIELIKGDLAKRSTWSKLEACLDKEKAAHGVVYNIGGSFGKHGWRDSLKNYEYILQLNFLAAVRAVDLFLPFLIRSESPKIILVLSKSIKDLSGNTPYVAAKMALYGYLRSITPHLASLGLSISGVAPGALDYPNRYPGKLRKAGGPEWESFRSKNCITGDLVSPDKVAQTIYCLLREPSLCFSGSVIDVN